MLSNNYIIISNPGSEPIELSNYLVTMGISKTPEQMIKETLPFANRYNYYIPGYDYPTVDTLAYQPRVMLPDEDVNPVIEAEGSFVIGHFERTNPENYIHLDDCDIIINKEYSFETNTKLIISGPNSIMNNGWMASVLCLFKILYDLIRNATKSTSDPEDFELIDVFGTFDGSEWSPDGASLPEEDNKCNITRKPAYWLVVTLPGFLGTWGINPHESEWICTSKLDYTNMGFTSGETQAKLIEETGTLAFDPNYSHLSTIASSIYNIVTGYLSPQNISNVPDNTNFLEFLATILKYPGQNIVLKAEDGSVKGYNAFLADGDTLVVSSANGLNVTKYAIETGIMELSSNARLIDIESSNCTLNENGSTGSIGNIPSETSIATILENIIIPDNAVLLVFDGENKLIPFKIVNNTRELVNITAIPGFNFEVTAEDNYTQLLYRLHFIESEEEVYAWSDSYTVEQGNNEITSIPNAINVATLFNNLFANRGSSIHLIVRLGIQRIQGPVAEYYQVEHTSANGEIKRICQLTFDNFFLGDVAYISSTVYAVNQEALSIENVEDGTFVSTFFDNISTAPISSVTIEYGNQEIVEFGIIENNYWVHVVSGDQQTEKQYQIKVSDLLNSEEILSFEEFVIDQENFKIEILSDIISIEDFLSNVTISANAIQYIKPPMNNQLK